MQTVTQELLDTFQSLREDEILDVQFGVRHRQPLLHPWYDVQISTTKQTYTTRLSRAMIYKLSNFHKYLPPQYQSFSEAPNQSRPTTQTTIRLEPCTHDPRYSYLVK